MRLSDAGRAGVLSLAMVPLVGVSAGFGDSEWTVLVGLGVILIAAGAFVWSQAARAKRQYRYPVAEARAAGEKVSNNLVAMSSAAILAVYGAGYFRTDAAAHRFAARSAQRMAVAVATGNLPVVPSSGLRAAVKAATVPVPPNEPGAREPSHIDSDTSAAAKTSSAAPAAERAAHVAKEASSPVISHHSNSTAAGSASTASAADAFAAATSAAATSAAAAPAQPPSPYKDGVFAAWGSCPHGDIQATVQIASGLIVAADVTECDTRYPCSLIDKLANEVVYQQTNDVDVVTGATESAQAFHEAIAKALAMALKGK